MNPQEIKHMIESGLKNSIVIIEGDDGQHFNATVVSDLFENKSRIEKQKLVYETLKNHIKDGTIHAISIKTFTPKEWKLTNHG